MKHNRTTNQPRENKMIAKAWSNEAGTFTAYTNGSEIFYNASTNTTTSIDAYGTVAVATGRVGI